MPAPNQGSTKTGHIFALFWRTFFSETGARLFGRILVPIWRQCFTSVPADPLGARGATVVTAPDLNFLVEEEHGVLELVDGHQHVLDDVVAVVELGDGLGLRQLEQGHLRGHHPAEQVAEPDLIPEGDDFLQPQNCERKQS